MRVHIVLLGLAPRLSALRILEEKGPPRVGLFVPLKRNVELGLERRETVRSLSAVLFLTIVFRCFWYERKKSTQLFFINCYMQHLALVFSFFDFFHYADLANKYFLNSEIFYLIKSKNEILKLIFFSSMSITLF